MFYSIRFLKMIKKYTKETGQFNNNIIKLYKNDDFNTM